MTTTNDSASRNSASISVYDSKGHEVLSQPIPREITARFQEDRTKRLRPEGNAQFIDISTSANSSIHKFQDDPFVVDADVKNIGSMFPTNRCKVLVLGAGLTGIQYAVHFIDKAGIRPEELRIVDSAGGFGGTWYWNRYPGLSCDIESYSYLPLLEETGYVPKHRYSYGDEIREYSNILARHWGFHDSAVFQTAAHKLEWDESEKEWKVELVQKRNGKDPQTVEVRAQFVALTGGPLNHAKLPDLPGLLEFQGSMFHTSRWDYSVTGGLAGLDRTAKSPALESPSLDLLKDKRVAIIGTGSTGIQCVGPIAKFAKHLYVIQRTPASVDHREQWETDPNWFSKHVATEPGWQSARLANFNALFSTGPKPKVNLVNDHWTDAIGMVATSGNPYGPKSMEEIPDYLNKLHALDLVRQERIRSRVTSIVRDKSVATQLQPWYPTWCKRPNFSDSFLEAFNLPNVNLIDTDGESVEGFTKDAVAIAGKEYPVDVIIFATGFRAPFVGNPAERANAKVLGVDGVSMTDEWTQNGINTLHGILAPKFPNLFLMGPWQASISAAVAYSMGGMGRHAASILGDAERRSGGKSYALSPIQSAAEEWGNQIAMRAGTFALGAGCLPNYFNLEGELDRLSPEQQIGLARSGLWGAGYEDYAATLRRWREDGGMERDLEIRM